MSFDYEALKNSAVVPLMQQFGDSSQVMLGVASPPTGAAYAPVRGEPTQVPATVVRTKVKAMDRQRLDVEQLDAVYLLSPEGITADPELIDNLVDGGTTYRVLKVEPLKPGPATMLWKLYCRK